MPTKRKFHKTTITVVILSEEAVPDFMSLEAIAHEGDTGSFVVDHKQSAAVELDGKAAADALGELRSEPEFFELDDEGNDLEDNDED